jgi:hypothetical protein
MDEQATNICYALLTRPSDAMLEARRSRQWGLATLIVALALLSTRVASAVLDGPHSAPLMGGVFFVVALVFCAVLTLAAWLALAVTCHAVAGLLGGHGSLGSCFSVLGLSAAPFVLATPLAILLRLTHAHWLVYAGLVFPLLCLWALVLAVIGIRQAYRLGGPLAFISLAIPPVLLVTGGTAIALFWVAALGRVLAGFIETLAI